MEWPHGAISGNQQNPEQAKRHSIVLNPLEQKHSTPLIA